VCSIHAARLLASVCIQICAELLVPTGDNMCICAQAAFRGQAQRLHPDHVSDPAKKPEATKRFQALLEAYQVLRDPSKRQAYDRGY